MRHRLRQTLLTHPLVAYTLAALAGPGAHTHGARPAPFRPWGPPGTEFPARSRDEQEALEAAGGCLLCDYHSQSQMAVPRSAVGPTG